MRITTLFRRLLGVTHLCVTSVALDGSDLVIFVRPTWRRARCGSCGERRGRYDKSPQRRWRHLGFGALKVWLSYAPRRVSCSSCGITTEAVPWARARSRFTQEFEELTSYLAQVTDKTTVTKLMAVSWHTVGAIVERVVADRKDPDVLKHLRNIGVDEFSYRRRHNYITTVVDHDRRRVVWAGPGRSTRSLKAFFEEIGEEAASRIEAVTIDMSQAYTKAIREQAPQATIVYDRFHVQRLASDALDLVRREQLRELRGTDEGRDIFRSRFVLLKNPWNLNQSENRKLSELQVSNARLYRAYLLKESLANALDYCQPSRAEDALKNWLSWASRSRLRPFVKAAKTIRRNLTGVLAYVRHRLTNGVVEGINTRLRMVARRAYGFHTADALISMLFLCCGGIHLNPPLPRTHKL